MGPSGDAEQSLYAGLPFHWRPAQVIGVVQVDVSFIPAPARAAPCAARGGSLAGARQRVERGRGPTPCFRQAAVPDPGSRGVLRACRLSPSLSVARSRRPCRPPHALNRRPEGWTDRHWDARSSIRSWMSMRKMFALSAVHVRGEQEGEHGGGTGPRARCSPSPSPGPTRVAVDPVRLAMRCSTPTSISAASCRTRASGGALVPPDVRRRRRGGQSQYRGVSDHAFWTAWPAKPAASEVVAHATLSLPQPERFVVGRVASGRRRRRVRCAS